MNEFPDPPPLIADASWRWPHQVPLDAALRIGDVGMILNLERSPPDLWRSWQTRRLRRMLAHVAAVSPLWRDWLGIDPASADAADMDRLPVLDRARFRDMVERQGVLPLPAGHGQTMLHSTSGSTGMPVSFHLSTLAMRVVRDHYYADNLRHGRDNSLRRAALGSRVDPHPGHEHVFSRGEPWLGESHVYTRHNLQFSFDEHARWLARLDPTWLAVNPTVLSGILECFELGSAGVQAGRSLRQVMTFGATVEPQLRARTRAVLGAGIGDRYSCEEIGPIALQCPGDDSRYHVTVSNAIVEVVDDAGRALPHGTPGRVLITGLHHWASPAVRYDVGDIATLHPVCTCGARVPVLTDLLGRRRGLIRAPSGRRYFVRLTASDWLGIAPVREHRFIQQDLRQVRIELVVAQPLSAAQREQIMAMLHRRVSSEFDFQVVELDHIDWPPGPKRQDVVVLV